ncbi:hypothetical protein [Streptomyces sp. NPDC052042]
MSRRRPSVGDEVTDGRTSAIVTDIRDGVLWLRAPGRAPGPPAMNSA